MHQIHCLMIGQLVINLSDKLMKFFWPIALAVGFIALSMMGMRMFEDGLDQRAVELRRQILSDNILLQDAYDVVEDTYTVTRLESGILDLFSSDGRVRIALKLENQRIKNMLHRFVSPTKIGTQIEFRVEAPLELLYQPNVVDLLVIDRVNGMRSRADN